MIGKIGIACIIMVIVSSCGSTKELKSESIVSELIVGRAQKINYNHNKSDSVTCSIEYAYFLPGKMAYRDSVNYKLKKFVRAITLSNTESSGSNQINNAFFNAQLDTFVEINKSEIAEIGEFEDGLNHLWELEALVEIDDANPTFAQLHLTAWSYTGGAHGNGATTSICIDKQSARVLKLEDVFTDVAAVTAIGEVYFRKLYELEPDTDLDNAGFWFENNSFHLNNNFTISNEHIVFLYNSYEIAPYSAGQTVLEIPLEEVRNYLKIKF